MIIKKSEFVTSLDRMKAFPGQGLPEIVLAGKSNVGKSSLINCVSGNGHLARTSSAPGKTRLINLYRLNGQVFLVDLPGYGFAKASKAERVKWAGMIEGYLAGSENISRVLLLVDLRHDPTQDDQDMAEYLRHFGRDFSVVATKADKVSKPQRMKHIHAICRSLQVQPWEVIPFSSEDGTGREQVIRLIFGETEAKTEE